MAYGARLALVHLGDRSFPSPPQKLAFHDDYLPMCASGAEAGRGTSPLSRVAGAAGGGEGVGNGAGAGSAAGSPGASSSMSSSFTASFNI